MSEIKPKRSKLPRLEVHLVITWSTVAVLIVTTLCTAGAVAAVVWLIGDR